MGIQLVRCKRYSQDGTTRGATEAREKVSDDHSIYTTEDVYQERDLPPEFCRGQYNPHRTS